MKSRYSASAPTIAYDPVWPSGIASAIAFSRCASYAVRPVNTTTPTNAVANCSASFCQKIPTNDASTTPTSPMNRNWPQPARLLRVSVPHPASAPNMPAETTNVDAIDSPVKTSSTNDIVTPVSAEYPMNNADGVDAARVCPRPDRTRTIPNCAMMRPQKSRLFRAIATISVGVEATNMAISAVIASPAHIQP